MAFRDMRAVFSVSAAVCSVVVSSSAWAQSKAFDVRAQAAASGIPEFARQADIQILISEKAVRGKRTKAVRGTMSVSQALKRLIAGTGLKVISNDGRTVTLAPAGGDTSPVSSADSDAPHAQVGGAVSEILVIGQQTLNAGIRRSEDDTQPYVVLDREDIERSGATNVESFIRQEITAQSQSFSTMQLPSSLGNVSQIDLRGLGANQTLILVDGRRLPSVTIQGEARQSDINGIPLAAIERIEVLPSTAGGIYGGGATGGVINIVLRRDYNGVEVTAQYGNTDSFDRHSVHLDATGGLNLNDGATRIIASASYSETGDLLVGERDLLQRGRERILTNSPATIVGSFAPPLGATTNIQSVTGTNLTLKDVYGGGALGSNFTSVPVGYAGPASDNGEALIDQAGQFNLDLADSAQFNGGGLRALLAGSRTYGFDVSVQQDVAADVELYGEVAYTRNEGHFVDNAASYGSIYVDSSAPSNPFNEAIYVNVPLTGADQGGESLSTDWRVLGGVRFGIAAGWRGSLEYNWSRGRFGSTTTYFGLSPDPSGDVASGALDVFRDTTLYPIDFSPYTPDFVTYGPGGTTLGAATLRLSGPLGFNLPGGMPTATLLAEYRHEHLDSYFVADPGNTQVAYARSQQVGAVYGEVVLPLVGPQNNIPLVHSLELQVAARGELYDISGSNVSNDYAPIEEDTRKRSFSSINPTISLKWAPSEDIALRGSYATGFLPPAMNQLVPSGVFVYTNDFLTLLNALDPVRGNEVIGGGASVAFNTGGNPDLDPETSKSWSLGLIVTPRFVPGLRLSADWTRIHKTGNIVNFISLGNPDSLTEAMQFAPERFTRNTDPASFGPYDVGPVTTVDASLINIAAARFRALDFAASYDRDLDSDVHLSVEARATRLLESETQASPDSNTVDNVGLINGLKWRGVGSATISVGRVSASWKMTYFGPYDLNAFFVADQGADHVRAQAYHDFYLGYRFGDGFAGLKNAELRLTVNNVFDRNPPFDASASSTAYYSVWGSPLGREFNLSAKVGF